MNSENERKRAEDVSDEEEEGGQCRGEHAGRYTTTTGLSELNRNELGKMQGSKEKHKRRRHNQMERTTSERVLGPTITGEPFTVLVRVWNETISNLTLMALGLSAPEILLSVFQICGNTFEAGELGPSTIVSSAAFNIFIIIAVLC
uniref:Na_Ca_ex domain-containing protein n=1 Tax=Caenorhabditis tropicalis TaxID=1561998 RepID=A0A1I7T5M6_9PELO